MRIGIDGRAFRSPAGGVRRYVGGLVPALRALDERLDVVALGGDPSSLPDIEHVPEPAHPPTNLGWTLVGLPRAAARARVDVIHAPAYTGPFWAGVPVVVSVHDVSYARHPEWYPYRRDWARRTFYRRSAKAAANVVTCSEFSKTEIQAAYGIASDRITVAPLGVDARFRPSHAGDACELPARVSTPFLLHVGDLHERRNLAVVIEALVEARRRFGALPALSLVLAGVDRGIGDALCALAARLDAADAVVLLGVVEEEHLRALYQGATAVVYPSLYEGFGLPVLEAMASGTPVIASTAGSIPEVLGDAGILIDPMDIPAWTDAIVRVTATADVRERMRAAGLARAAGFTWERTARLTAGAYRRVLRG